MDDSTITIPVDKTAYEDTLGKFSGQTTIAEYSVTVDRTVHHDRSNARYIHEASIGTNDVNFDLIAGFSIFIDKGKLLQSTPTLGPLSEWAIGHPGATLEEVFGDAEFASWRGTMKRVALTLNYTPPRDPWRGMANTMKNSWKFVAQDFGGVIIICEAKEYDAVDLPTYTGFKFEQYITTHLPEGTPNTKVPVDNRPTFEIMVRTDLEVGEKKLKLCCGAELDAIRIVNGEEQKIEIKTAWENDWTDRSMNVVMQNEIVGVRNFIVGKKKGDLRRRQCKIIEITEKTLNEFKSTDDTERRSSQCYAFLFDVLSKTKEFLQSNEACRVSFNPSELVVQIESISRAEADFKGHGISDEFMKRFNL